MVPTRPLPVAFDHRDRSEVLLAAIRAADLAQVGRPCLGERPRLVDAAEHREQRRPCKVRGARRSPGGKIVEDPQALVRGTRAEDQRPVDELEMPEAESPARR